MYKLGAPPQLGRVSGGEVLASHWRGMRQACLEDMPGDVRLGFQDLLLHEWLVGAAPPGLRRHAGAQWKVA